MPVKQKRTRKQKEKATKKRESITYSLPTVVASSKTTEGKKAAHEKDVRAFFSYDITVVYKDLLKTVGISFILIASLVCISMYLK